MKSFSILSPSNSTTPLSSYSIQHSSSLRSLLQDLLRHLVHQHNVAASASAVACNRPAEHVCVGVAESRQGVGADD